MPAAPTPRRAPRQIWVPLRKRISRSYKEKKDPLSLGYRRRYHSYDPPSAIAGAARTNCFRARARLTHVSLSDHDIAPWPGWGTSCAFRTLTSAFSYCAQGGLAQAKAPKGTVEFLNATPSSATRPTNGRSKSAATHQAQPPRRGSRG